jgi:serine/threonine protein kinase
MEEWIARRISHPHVLKPGGLNRKKQFLYVTTEYIEGCTLTQWMRDHPQPDLETVRNLIDQIARGLQAFHRLEMLHQDLRPDNILIDAAGTVKLIDFGSASVAGVVEAIAPAERGTMLGTPQYTAPEYFPVGGRHDALRPVFARRHRLPATLRPAALRRRSRQVQERRRAEAAQVRLAAANPRRCAGVGRWCDQKGGAPQSRVAL